jgi:site-specific recombinase XerD
METVTARAGLTPTRSLHILRHTFCSHLAMTGAPSRAIQRMAGHASIVTTECYMHLSQAALGGAIRLLDEARSKVREERGEAGEKVPVEALN